MFFIYLPKILKNETAYKHIKNEYKGSLQKKGWVNEKNFSVSKRI